MAQSFADVAKNIGSPLPDYQEQLKEDIIAGRIELLQNLFDFNQCSQVTLRSAKEIGIDCLNSRWVFTPTYLDGRSTPLSYSLGFTNPDPKDTYIGTLRQINTQAEQAFYYGPLRALRAHLIRHDDVSGKTCMPLPENWYVNLSGTFTDRKLTEVLEMFCMPNAVATKFLRTYYEHIFEFGWKHQDSDTDTKTTQVICACGDVRILDTPVVLDKSFIDLTNLFRFVLCPFDHGLDQEQIRRYKDSVPGAF